MDHSESHAIEIMFYADIQFYSGQNTHLDICLQDGKVWPRRYSPLRFSLLGCRCHRALRCGVARTVSIFRYLLNDKTLSTIYREFITVTDFSPFLSFPFQTEVFLVVL